MKFHVAFVLIFLYMKIANLQDVYGAKGQNIENDPDANMLSKANKTGAAVGVNEGLSSENLSELHHLAKNISHSKGIYRQSDKESEFENEREMRRSILKKIAVSTESDVIKSLLHNLRLNKDDKLRLLEKMEYLVHEYDVAINFAVLGGLDAINHLLLSSDEKIVSSAATVLGAAVQSNPTVQKLATMLNVGENLVKQLSHKSPVVVSKVIFALGSFLRNIPEAQENFLELNGVEKLSEILQKHMISTNTKLKIINLFSDLAVEQQTAKLYPNERNMESFKKLEMLFITEIQRSNVCQMIPPFLHLEDFDTHQKIVAAMTSMCSICLKEFNNEKVYSRIKKLLKLYDPERDGEGPIYPLIDKDLKRAMHGDLKFLLKEIYTSARNKSKAGGKKTEL